MFSAFIKEGAAALIIRTENLQRIVDIAAARRVYWQEGDAHFDTLVQGTAAENYSRLQSEELRLIEAAAERQRRFDGGLPLSPIPRGRAGR